MKEDDPNSPTAQEPTIETDATPASRPATESIGETAAQTVAATETEESEHQEHANESDAPQTEPAAKPVSSSKNKSVTPKGFRWLLAIIGILLIGTVVWMVSLALAKAPTTYTLYIYPDTEYDELADTLSMHMGEDWANTVVYLLPMDRLGSRCGAYKIDEGTTAWQAARMIKTRTQSPVKVTFNNVRTLDQLAERIGSRMLISPEELRDTLLAPASLHKYGCDTATIVTLFLPDTYELYWTSDASSIIASMAKYHDRFWNEERRAKAAALGLTPAEVATVASIVEEETNDKQERPIVARLYLNRIHKGMKLQADPTVKFAIGDFAIRRITADMLAYDSPYNTYLYAGLPPGPIRIPDKATLEAVLNAPEYPYLYMCAREDFSGKHNFTDSYSVHIANARRYQQALNQRGIMR